MNVAFPLWFLFAITNYLNSEFLNIYHLSSFSNTRNKFVRIMQKIDKEIDLDKRHVEEEKEIIYALRK